MNVITKERCPICGRILEKYPNNGEPLIQGHVCLTCNNGIIIPYRYFLSMKDKSCYAMLVKSGHINLIKTTDKAFKKSDIELYLGKDITFKREPKLGLTVAFIKREEEELNDLNKTLVRALKAPNFKTIVVMPNRLMKGVKLNE